ncbi:MAG: glycine dehydrogenase, partial [Bacilli bacterium]
MFKYFPHTESDIQKMLDTIGVKEIDDLFQDIPSSLIRDRWPDLENSLSEIELRQRMDKIAAKNQRLICFAGAGTYDHYVPSIIPPLVSRQEFLTSYTPYQPEIAQGTLTYIFEYQSYMTSLTGMDVSNASMYDGATATAEACLMAVQDKRVPRILL